MTKRSILKNTLLAIGIFASTAMSAGGLEKGFEALAIKDYFKAYKIFEKVMYRNPTGGSYGFSLIFTEPKNAYFNLDSALKYIVRADSSYHFASSKQRTELSTLGITRTVITDHRLHIADVAYEQIRDDSNPDQLGDFLKRYPFSRKYREIVEVRDSIAFEQVKKEDSYKAYRQFIIDYPGSDQRQVADSLYALKFYEEKTSDGDVESFKAFVKEFSSSPHTLEAYEQVYEGVKDENTVEVYLNHIRSFPESPYVDDAWQQIVDFSLMVYTKESIASLLWDYPDNPHRLEVENELKILHAPRFDIKSTDGMHLVDVNGKRVTTKAYDSIDEYVEGLAIVTSNGKTGYIDKRGIERIELKFDDAFPFSNGAGVVELEGLYGAVNRRGEVIIPIEYEDMGQFQDFIIPVSKGSGFIYLNRFGEVAIPEIYEEASDFVNGHAVVKLEGKYGLINLDGEVKIPALFDWVEPFEENCARVKKDGKFGIYKKGSGLTAETEYDAISSLSDGMRIMAKEGKFGYGDIKGEEVISAQFDFEPAVLKESMFHLGHAKIEKYNLFGVIDKTGEFVLEPKYIELGDIRSSIIWYRDLNRYGFIDFGGTVVDATFDYVSNFVQGVAVAGIDGKKGLINVRGEWLIPAIYDDLESVIDTELCVFQKDAVSGVVHRDSKELISGTYDKIEIIRLRYAKMTNGENCSYYDLDNNKPVYTLAE